MGAVIALLKRSVQSFGADKCATLSASLAYRTIFALFPLALLGVSLLGFFVGDESARRQVVDGITRVIPLGDQGEQGLAETLGGVSRARGWLGLIGLLTAAWSASGLFGEFRRALDEIWDVDRPLPMLRAKARDVLILFGFGGLLGASTASTGILQAARAAGGQWLGPIVDLAGPVFGLLAFFAPLLLTFAAFMFLYKLAPHARLNWRDVLPAAVLAALFFEFGKNLLAYYIRNLGNFNALAGSLGAAILFLVFVYYASMVILFAAEIAKHLMLVRCGALPATDEKVPKPKAPLPQKVKGTLLRLWQVDSQHHDYELPYTPSRLDPDTNRPTNTREEVLYKQQEARENAIRDARDTHPGDGRAAAPAGTRRTTVLHGRAVLHEGMLSVQSREVTRPLAGTRKLQVTRNGEPASLDDMQLGDELSVQVNADGQIQRVDARSRVEQPDERVDWAAVAGFFVTLARQWRQRRAERRERAKKKRKPGPEGRAGRRARLLQR